jgi:hypothetical protein
VVGERRLRILSLLDHGDSRGETARLCEVCAEVAAVTGAGIMLLSGGSSKGSICTSNAVSARLEDLQYDLGEGPCLEAFASDRPVLEPDLARPEVHRWVAFSGPALEAGARAVFGFPLRVGAVRLGALNLYRDLAGPLTDDQHADALVLAEVAALAVLDLQAEAPSGQLAGELAAGADFHLVVHQAAGMVAAQLDVDIREALVRLRAYAFGNGRRLDSVAADVVSRTVRFAGATGGDEGAR